MEIKDLVAELAEARRRLSDLTIEADDIQEQIDETDLGQRLAVLNGDIKAVKGVVKAIDGKLRDTVLDRYLETGEKQLGYGCSVRTYKRVKISDDRTMIEYLERQIPFLIMRSINIDALEKMLKAGVDIPGAWIEDEPRASIARDLSEYLTNS